MNNFKETLKFVSKIENWDQAPSLIIDLKNEFNLNLLAVLSPDEIESGEFYAQFLIKGGEFYAQFDEIFAIMPAEIVIQMLTQVKPTNEPIDVYKSNNTIVLAYQPIDN